MALTSQISQTNTPGLPSGTRNEARTAEHGTGVKQGRGGHTTLRAWALSPLAALLLAPAVQAEPIRLASADILATPRVTEPIGRVSFYVEYPPDFPQGCNPCATPPPGPRVLERDFGPMDVGSRVTADRRSDPEFGAFVSRLQNNRPDELLFFSEVPPGHPDIGGFGRSMIDTVLFPVNWSSYRVTAVSFLLTDFTFDTTNPTELGGRTFFNQRFGGRFEVFGDAAPVPEPASLTLVGVGLAAARWRARRRR